ncbi:MAG: hypothetical protein L6R39_004769 [Caloplaca ligustica]|nr:MAG: hypothetical protein L6R39_004769 [Caloplaca ligustica]
MSEEIVSLLEMEMEDIADAIISDPETGLAVEQRKRVVIGVVLLDYFRKHGAHCPPDANPAEWMLNAVGAALTEIFATATGARYGGSPLN